MKPGANPNWFANNPLDRAFERRDDPGFIEAARTRPDTVLVPLWRGDPLIHEGAARFLSGDDFAKVDDNAPWVFLGLLDGAAHFAVDLSAAPDREKTVFSDVGEFVPIREAATIVDRSATSIIGHARWLFEWHRKHQYCAVCGGETQMRQGGAKRQCIDCGAEHFPRCDPVAIVLAVHDGACLLGRSPRFPPTFFSALAGYIEAAETPEEAAKRELFEEAGVVLTDVRYQFSQPWPFPTTLMMGFIADAEGRDITLDTNEIVEALWVSKDEIRAILGGQRREDLRLPPQFTIARQLIDVWARND
ncbi:MAG: NAD(+) diphosphatase [Pseudomonadota bacterium]